jgi:hypothetical protein
LPQGHGTSLPGDQGSGRRKFPGSGVPALIN